MDESEFEAVGVSEEDDGRPRAAAVRLLGTKIIASADGYQQGEVLRLDAVMNTISGSRALAREVLQALQYKGMVTLRTRVGATVQPMREWNIFDPDVIAWRLEEEPYELMLSMTELRHAIEPRAAFLAA